MFFSSNAALFCRNTRLSTTNRFHIGVYKLECVVYTCSFTLLPSWPVDWYGELNMWVYLFFVRATGGMGTYIVIAPGRYTWMILYVDTVVCWKICKGIIHRPVSSANLCWIHCLTDRPQWTPQPQPTSHCAVCRIHHCQPCRCFINMSSPL